MTQRISPAIGFPQIVSDGRQCGRVKDEPPGTTLSVLVAVCTLLTPVIIGYCAANALIGSKLCCPGSLGNLGALIGFIICITSTPLILALYRKSAMAAVVWGMLFLAIVCTLSFLDLPLLML